MYGIFLQYSSSLNLRIVSLENKTVLIGLVRCFQYSSFVAHKRFENLLCVIQEIILNPERKKFEKSEINEKF